VLRLVAKGKVLTYQDVAMDEDSFVVRLRKLQDMVMESDGEWSS
jgi:predicted homoserine dehydrogenase-like protein